MKKCCDLLLVFLYVCISHNGKSHLKTSHVIAAVKYLNSIVLDYHKSSFL